MSEVLEITLNKLNEIIEQQGKRIKELEDTYPLRMNNMAKQKCKWTYDDSFNLWLTECGDEFSLITGTPSDNKMRFCPYCGRILVERK